MKIKKMIALFLSLVLCGSLLVGCGDTAVIEIKALGELSVGAGKTLDFTAELKKGKADKLVFAIKSGSESAILTNTESGKATLTVRPAAIAGAQIVVHAFTSDGGSTSNELVVTVKNVPIQSISLSSGASAMVLRGQKIPLLAAVLPEGASSSGLSYQITAGEAHAELDADGVLTVKGSAPKDFQIKVRASIGGIFSNELTFTVDENADTEFSISLNQDEFKLDKNGGSVPNITATVLDYDGKENKDVEVTYTVTEGASVVSVESKDNTGYFSQLAHGTATVTARVSGTNATAQCTVSSIVPPEAFFAPSNIPESAAVRFGYSKADSLPYAPRITDSKACQTYKVSFKKGDIPSADIAAYDEATKEITFKPETSGEVKVIVTSDSGSIKETTFERTVIVNDGINVKTMAQFTSVMNNYGNQADQSYKTVNLLSDLKGLDNLPAADQTLPALRGQTILSYGDRFIYGNNHTIDLSNLRIPSYNEWKASGMGNFPGFIKFIGYAHDAGGWLASDKQAFTVQMYDLDIKGNITTSTPFDASETPGNRAYRHAINIEPIRVVADHDNNSSTPNILIKEASQYCENLIMDGVSVDGFTYGTALGAIVDGKVKNCSFQNAYGSNVDVKRSIIEFENVRFGHSGVAGIEINSDNATESGRNFEQTQTVTFTGDTKSDNMTDGKTPHMVNDDTLNGFPQLLLANLTNDLSNNLITDDRIKNVLYAEGSEDGSLNWFIFIKGTAESNIVFKDANGNVRPSAVGDYFSEISGIDTAFQYLKITVRLNGAVAGTVYAANLNYGKTAA